LKFSSSPSAPALPKFHTAFIGMNSKKLTLGLLKYTKNINEKEFFENTLIQDAVIRRFEIIGEAVKNIPMSLKEKNKSITYFSSHYLAPRCQYQSSM
jgi:hypothetical protein